jgi:5-epi-alpha-selinene synthase
MENIVLPTLDCPFPPAVNPHAKAAQQHNLEWAQRLRLAAPADYQHFYASNFAGLAARTYPNAPCEELMIVADWCTWLFLQDDDCDEASVGAEPTQLAARHARFRQILRGAEVTTEDLPLTHALFDLRQRMRRRTTAVWMQRFSDSVGDYLDANIWEATNRQARRTPDVATYLAKRPFTGAMYACLDLIDLTEGIDLPAAVRCHREVRRLSLMAINVVCWSNDILSLAKELQHGDLHNLVIALCAQYKLTLREAINRAAELHNAEVRAFLILEAHLPSFGKSVDAELRRYVAVLRAWMRGNLDWTLAAIRYRPANSATAA